MIFLSFYPLYHRNHNGHVRNRIYGCGGHGVYDGYDGQSGQNLYDGNHSNDRIFHICCIYRGKSLVCSICLYPCNFFLHSSNVAWMSKLENHTL